MINSDNNNSNVEDDSDANDYHYYQYGKPLENLTLICELIDHQIQITCD